MTYPFRLIAHPPLQGLDEVLFRAQREYLQTLLFWHGGNVAQAARHAGRNRTEFYRLLERSEINLRDYDGIRTRKGTCLRGRKQQKDQ